MDESKVDKYEDEAKKLTQHRLVSDQVIGLIAECLLKHDARRGKETCETCAYGKNCPIRRNVIKLDEGLPPPITRNTFGCTYHLRIVEKEK